MKLTVKREKTQNGSTFGELLLNGKSFSPKVFTIEDDIRAVKIHGETAIPAGNYKLDIRTSPKFSKSYKLVDPTTFAIQRPTNKNPHMANHPLLWVKGVPNYEFILIHWGNTDADTEGCLLVGNGKGVVDGKPAVISSRACYERIYPIIRQEMQKAISQKIEPTIEYING